LVEGDSVSLLGIVNSNTERGLTNVKTEMMVNGKVVAPDKEIPISLSALRELLGGPLEITPLDKRAVIVRGKHGNGSLAVCGLNEDYLTSLHPYSAQQYKYELAQRAREESEQKPSILSALGDAKKQAAEQLPKIKTTEQTRPEL